MCTGPTVYPLSADAFDVRDVDYRHRFSELNFCCRACRLPRLMISLDRRKRSMPRVYAPAVAGGNLLFCPHPAAILLGGDKVHAFAEFDKNPSFSRTSSRTQALYTVSHPSNDRKVRRCRKPGQTRGTAIALACREHGFLGPRKILSEKTARLYGIDIAAQTASSDKDIHGIGREPLFTDPGPV